MVLVVRRSVVCALCGQCVVDFRQRRLGLVTAGLLVVRAVTSHPYLSVPEVPGVPLDQAFLRLRMLGSSSPQTNRRSIAEKQNYGILVLPRDFFRG
jgi:hypothetical protein